VHTVRVCLPQAVCVCLPVCACLCTRWSVSACLCVPVSLFVSLSLSLLCLCVRACAHMPFELSRPAKALLAVVAIEFLLSLGLTLWRLITLVLENDGSDAAAAVSDTISAAVLLVNLCTYARHTLSHTHAQRQTDRHTRTDRERHGRVHTDTQV
jgi:hypothetical protein